MYRDLIWLLFVACENATAELDSMNENANDLCNRMAKTIVIKTKCKYFTQRTIKLFINTVDIVHFCLRVNKTLQKNVQ